MPVRSQKYDLALSFDDVLLRPQYSDINSRSEVDLSIKLSPKITLKIPLISANMDTVTGVEMAIAMGKLGGLGILPRFDNPEISAEKVKKIKEARVYAAVSVGIKNGESERTEYCVKAGADIINIDVAHGHMQQALEKTSELKNKYGSRITIFSGICATKDAAEDHFKAGADVVTMGVGGGSICTTRIMTGSGIPTFQSIQETAPIARKYKKAIVPLAGIKNSGDIVKSLAAGASAIWAGSLFAGCDECPGEIMEINGKFFKQYNGSTSKLEKQKQVVNYARGKDSNYIYHVEGVEAMVECKGPVEELVKSLVAGIRSGLTYSGARTIPQLWEKAEFVRITGGGMRESQAHDVVLQ